MNSQQQLWHWLMKQTLSSRVQSCIYYSVFFSLHDGVCRLRFLFSLAWNSGYKLEQTVDASAKYDKLSNQTRSKQDKERCTELFVDFDLRWTFGALKPVQRPAERWECDKWLSVLSRSWQSWHPSRHCDGVAVAYSDSSDIITLCRWSRHCWLQKKY